MIHFVTFTEKRLQLGGVLHLGETSSAHFTVTVDLLSFDNKSLNSPNIPFFHDKY